MNEEKAMVKDAITNFTEEEIAAAAAIVLGLIRSVAADGEDIEEVCGECGCTTRWSEAMYDLLATQWVCPKCWADDVG